MKNRLRRLARWIFTGLVLAELLYLVAGNTALLSGIIPHVVNRLTIENTLLNVDWDWALTPWPGRVYVSGFRFHVQDPVVQVHLLVGYAKADVVLSDLFRNKFRATHAQAEGVYFRLIPRFASADGIERRAAAFPVIEGLPRPALLPSPRLPFPSPSQLAKMWDVEFDSIDASLSEIWVMEYRYEGEARVHGGFGLVPLRRLWVAPSQLQLTGGVLTLGPHQVSRSVNAAVALTIVPVDLLASPGALLLSSLSASVHLDAAIGDLSAVELYVDGLRLRGGGRLDSNLKVEHGRLMPGSGLHLSLLDVEAQIAGSSISAGADATLSVPVDDKTPTVRVTANGEVKVPLPGSETALLELSRATADLVLSGNDFSQGVGLKHLSAVLGEARMKDARPISALAGKYVPVIAPLELGDGPLVASARAYMTPDYKLIRLLDAKLGHVEVEGAAVERSTGWSGAAAGHVGTIPIGLRLREGAIEGVRLVPATWLPEEIRKAGIDPA